MAIAPRVSLSTAPLSTRAANAAPASFSDTPSLRTVSSALAAGVASGIADAGTWSGAADDARFARFGIAKIGTPPDAATTRQELAFLHIVQDGRNTADTAVATWLDKHGQSDVWQQLLRDWQRTVPADQARAGAALLQRAVHLADDANHQAKRAYPRQRPFAVDPTLTPISVDPMNPNFTYPSAHATDAFAAAQILASLMPARAAEFEHLAEGVAYARVYSAVHFPSDVAAGARLGAMAAAYVLATSRRLGAPAAA